MENDTNESIDERVEEKMIFKEEPQIVEGQLLNTMIYQSIGGFTFINVKKESSAGSGVLISRNLVLTAAHNLYDKKSQQEFNKKSYRFYYQATNGIATKFYEVADWRFLPQYITCLAENKFQFDYALVKLEESVDLTSFPPLTLPCKVCLDNKKQQLGIFGYPNRGQNYKSDSQGKSIKFRQFGLKREFKIAFFEPQSQLIGYAISTLPGHSGSPVIFDEKIIAVHNGAGRTSQAFNIGKLVTNNLLNNLTSWADQLKGEIFVTSHCEHVLYKREQLLQQAQTLIEKGYAEFHKCSYNSALDYYSQCLQIQIEAVGKGGRETALTLYYIGWTYYAQKNDTTAIECYKQYISIKEKYSQEKRGDLYIGALSHLGKSYNRIKDFKLGAEYFEQRLLHNQQIQYQNGAKCCAKWLARYQSFWGESKRAEELKQKYKI